MALTRNGNCKNDFQHNWFKHRKDFPMNELSVIGSLCLSTDFQDRTGQTLQLARKKYMAKYVLTSKIAILEKDYRFFFPLFYQKWKFQNISHKSPRNNSIEPFQFLDVVKSTSSFFLHLVIQKSATIAISKKQEIEMVCLRIKYYRDTVYLRLK